MAYIRNLSFSFLLIFSFLSCKTTSKTFVNEGKAPERSLDEVLKNLKKNALDFTWYDAKIDIDFDGSNIGGSGTAYLRMKKDSAVWVAVKKLGIEGGRLFMTKDSVFLINRLERYFQQGNVSEVKSRIGFDLEMVELQHMLAGNLFIPNLSEIKSFKQNGQSCIIEAMIQGNLVTYNVNAFNMLPQGILMNDGNNRYLEIVYHEYKKSAGCDLPSKFDVFFESKEMTGEMKLNVKDVHVNVPKDLSFSIPSHYDEITW